MRILFVLLLLSPIAAAAQTYQATPIGGGQYRIEPVAPLPSFDVAGFEAAVAALRSAEGISPGATVRLLENPSSPVPLEACSDPDGTIRSCNDEQVTVQ